MTPIKKIFNRKWFSPTSPILLGAGLWLLLVGRSLPFSLFDLSYVQLLILAAPLFLIPLAWSIVLSENRSGKTQLLAVLAVMLLVISFHLPIGLSAALWSIPWLVFCIWMAVDRMTKFYLSSNRGMANWSQLMAHVYLPVGAAWAFADRLGFYPFDFSPSITLLTAAHFHYAGFLLPLMVSWLIQKNPTMPWAGLISWGVILGIPLVAIGITSTHFQWPVVIEVFAVTIMASAGAATGVWHMVLGIHHFKTGFGRLWIIAGIALLGGMTLAMLYGWRHYFPVPALTIPWMYAVHGTLNAIGFALPGILGWFYFFKNEKKERLS